MGNGAGYKLEDGYYNLFLGNNAGYENVHGSGNVFTTGTFAGRVDFDPGVGNFYLTAIGYYDAFITKKNASGNLIWAKQLSGDADGNSIAISPNGNICIAGTFAGTVDFDPGVGVYNLTSAGSSDDFICMLNASGNLIWSRQFGNTGQDIAVAVTTDASNNVYTAGNFSVAGRAAPPRGREPIRQVTGVTPGYFQALGMQLRASRVLSFARSTLSARRL